MPHWQFRRDYIKRGSGDMLYGRFNKAMTPDAVAPSMSTIDYSLMPFTVERKPAPTIEELLSTYKLEQTLTVPASDAIMNITEITIGLSELRLPQAFNYDINITHNGKTVMIFEAYDLNVDGIASTPDLFRNLGFGESPYVGAGRGLLSRCGTFCAALPLCVQGETNRRLAPAMKLYSQSLCGNPLRPSPTGCYNTNCKVETPHTREHVGNSQPNVRLPGLLMHLCVLLAWLRAYQRPL